MHLSQSFGGGGAAIGVVQIINGIIDKNITHTVCSVSPKLFLKERLTKNINCYSLNIRKTSRTAFLKIVKIIKENKIDIVHANNLDTWFDAAIVSQITGCRCIQTFHGIDSGKLKIDYLKKMLLKTIVKSTDSVTAVSESGSKLLSKNIGINSKKMKLIPNGVDTNIYFQCYSRNKKKILRRKLSIREDGILFGCVAGFRQVKNHEGLIRAFSKLIRRCDGNSNFYLLLIGDGELKSRLINISRDEGIESQIIFMGQRRDVPDILRALDGFLLNSKTEGMSYAILEAMASGLPIIATDVGGNAELVKHGEEGFLYPEGDTPALVEYIQTVVKNRERLKIMGEKARRKVCSLYSLDKMVKAYQDLYEEVYRKKQEGEKIRR